jgi:alginate O-acetyltransferase complex protein AlgI
MPQRFQSKRFRAGFARVGIGLAKKVLFADVLAAYADPVFADPTGYSPLTAMVALYAYAFQIYFDFSGYCDMALGLAGMLDLRLVENFKWPYLASSITDYWRRWHMSLSRWLRDYVYIPLGGSREGRGSTYVNLMATMLVGGLWHGANWNFVIWGGLHGVFLAVERALGVRDAPTEPGARIARIALTFHLVVFAFLFFRIQSWAIGQSYLATLAGPWHGLSASDWKAIFLIVIAFLLHVADQGGRLRNWFANSPPLFQGAAVAAAVIMMLNLRNLHQPFVYFQF